MKRPANILLARKKLRAAIKDAYARGTEYDRQLCVYGLRFAYREARHYEDLSAQAALHAQEMTQILKLL